MSFFLSETTKIKENHIFNIEKKKNEDLIYKFYTSNASKEIIFEKDTNIFLELKTSAKNSKIDDISVKLLNMANRFFLLHTKILHIPL